MQGLDDLAVTEHLEDLRGIEDVHMDVLGFFLMLVPHFLHAGSQESIRAVVVVGRVRGEGHEKRPLAAFVTGLFG